MHGLIAARGGLHPKLLAPHHLSVFLHPKFTRQPTTAPAGHALRGPSGRGNAGRRLSEEKAGLAARTGAPPVASFYRVFVTVV